MSNNGPLTPTFAPFKSGCGVCRPSTDYYQQPQAGGIGNYSNDGLIPASNGKNFYKAQDFDVSDANIMKNNYNKEFSTSFGGKKSVSKKSKSAKSTKTNLKKKIVKKSSTVLKKKKKVMKGGTYAPYGASDNIEGPNTNSDVQSSNTQGNTVPGTFASTMFEPATFMSGGKSKKNNHKGGFSSSLSEEHHNMMYKDMMHKDMMHKDMMHKDMMHKDMMHKDMMHKDMSGGKNKKNNHKGGFSDIPGEETMDKEIMHGNMAGGKKIKSKSKSKPKTIKKSKSTKKMMSGGMETSGATPMNQRFYDINANLDNYPANSGNGIMSAYGPIVSGDIGSGMLAPYTASICSMANHNTAMKTGGSKTKNHKKQKGGMETMGATPLPQRFFNPDMEYTDYPMNSGKGVMSAYGAVEPNDIGSGMLAPYTTSKSPGANYNTGMKTGGSKNKKNLKGGDGPIPSISSQPVTDVQNTLTGAINDFSSFMQTLDQDYLNSVAQIENIKIGNQRLIQGGKSMKKPMKKPMMKSSDKKKSSVKKPTMKSSVKKPMMKSSVKKPTMKSSVKKPMMKSSVKKPMMKSSMKKPMMKSSDKKKSMKKSMKGGDGSDFALTLNSRGPANYPDNTWGVDGETWFRQFNKTGQYIPNSQLPNAATPLLAGTNDSNVVSGYNEMDISYQSV